MDKLSILAISFILFKVICAVGLTALGIIAILLLIAYLMRLTKVLVAVAKKRKIKSERGEELKSFSEDVSDYIDKHYD